MFAPSTLVATSLLQVGQSYSEDQLRDSAARIVRLPLILDAEYSLEKGSRRGQYRLLIRVEETRRWFFGVEVEGTWWADAVSVDGFDTRDHVDRASYLAGRRFSVGGQGLFFVVASGSNREVTLGYSQHQLFGRGGLLTASFSTAKCENILQRAASDDPPDDGSSPGDSHVGITPAGTECRTQDLLPTDPTPSSWSTGEHTSRFRLSLGVPVRGNHSIRLRADSFHGDSGVRREAFAPLSTLSHSFKDRVNQEFDLTWIYNSTDDPIFPTSGKVLEAGLRHRTLEAELTDLDLEVLGSVSFKMKSELTGISLIGRFHRPLAMRHSLSTGADLFLGERDVRGLPDADGGLVANRTRIWRAEAFLSHTSLLYQSQTRSNWRELRWIQRVTLFDGGESPEFDLGPNYLRGFEVTTELSFRTSWGVLSLGLSYLDREAR